MKKVAFIFPGQGSQKTGMGKDFFDNSDIAKDMINKASIRLGFDFSKLLFEDNSNLSQTKFTQPAILLVSCIAYNIFKSKSDISPEFCLGHSLGEFSSLVSSGAIDYLDAIELVHKRGIFMSEACMSIDAGMMAVLGIEDNLIEDICRKELQNGKKIWPANYNMNGQLVLAGIKKDLESLIDILLRKGAKKTVLLDMSVASHCNLLETAVKKLKPYLEKFIKDEFKYPIISNVSTSRYSSKYDAVDLLCKQLVNPVKYKQSILNNSNNIEYFIEFGNSTVLKGLNRKITKIPTLNINDMNSLEKTLSILND
jgi:[acyl-carrier-protein] S-malonyltransferase